MVQVPREAVDFASRILAPGLEASSSRELYDAALAEFENNPRALVHYLESVLEGNAQLADELGVPQRLQLARAEDSLEQTANMLGMAELRLEFAVEHLGEIARLARASFEAEEQDGDRAIIVDLYITTSSRLAAVIGVYYLSDGCCWQAGALVVRNDEDRTWQVTKQFEDAAEHEQAQQTASDRGGVRRPAATR